MQAQGLKTAYIQIGGGRFQAHREVKSSRGAVGAHSYGDLRPLTFDFSDRLQDLLARRRQQHLWGPRIIATNRQAPRIYPRMIPLCSRFDSVLFTPKMSAIASYGNYSRSPYNNL
jgi:hypothetical protein